MSATLIDSNVLVYLYDPRDHKKQEIAAEVIELLVDRRLAVLSVQSLTEFFRAVRWRLPEPIRLSHAVAEGQIERFVRTCRILNLTTIVVLEACRLTGAYSVSLWDALIWAAAKANNVSYVLTEDSAHGRTIEGIRYLNPFHSDFDLSELFETRL